MIDKEKWEKTLKELPDVPPATEPERQYYFIKKCRQIVQKINKERGFPLCYKTVTFGCQMNARDSEKLAGILEQIGYVEEPEEEKAEVFLNRSAMSKNLKKRRLTLLSTIPAQCGRTRTRESTGGWGSLDGSRKRIRI